MSTSVLPQLLEVDSELSAQATVLEAKLTQLQQKREGIQAVISMFESGEKPAASAISTITDASTTTKITTKKTPAGNKTKGRRKAGKSSTQSTAPKSTTTKASKPKASRGRPAKSKQSAASTKRSGKADWQRYIQTTYKKSPLPDVIVSVLQAQPNNVFKIADVMNLVFQENMPKSHFLKARNRISNILSAGARDGVWHRGGNGTYSMSEKAIKAS
ncbi:hypothetical protein S7335_4040 [Synechococcus sp. PCC 7335]|uniref:hypothetical protein n=1 Tax=Synechococcus sp. (strain ATCC 29403 / PCC 7335) TaxID=91464 RepID=UPI00017EE054|nr:hypothetical protein [Synechococcus sp. PCC 7335]EDX86337.1 hypothetical protein S7335_4040 [Synechococcus sp. PCC 7335]